MTIDKNARNLGTTTDHSREDFESGILRLFPLQSEDFYVDRYRAYEDFLNIVDGDSLAALRWAFTSRCGLVITRFRKMLDENLRREGQSVVRWHVLFEISLKKNPAQTLTKIAARVGLHSAGLVALLDDLEREGLIIRTVDSTDRRSKLISLTPAGSEALMFMGGLANEIRQVLFRQISEGELGLLLDAIERMSQALDEFQYERSEINYSSNPL